MGGLGPPRARQKCRFWGRGHNPARDVRGPRAVAGSRAPAPVPVGPVPAASGLSTFPAEAGPGRGCTSRASFRRRRPRECSESQASLASWGQPAGGAWGGRGPGKLRVSRQWHLKKGAPDVSISPGYTKSGLAEVPLSCLLIHIYIYIYRAPSLGPLPRP